MKKLVLFFILLVPMSLLGIESSKDTLPAFVGIWYIPKMNWFVDYTQHSAIGEPLSVDFRISSLMSVEGYFCHSPD